MKNMKTIAKGLAAITLFSLMNSFGVTAQDMNAGVSQPQNTNAPVKEEDSKRNSGIKRGEFGIRYMTTLTKVDVRTYKGEVVKGTLTMQQGFGIRLAYNVNKHFGVETEVNYYQVSQKYADRGLNRKVTIRYLQIPVLLSLNSDRTQLVNLNVVAGPQFGVNIGTSIKGTGNETSDTLRAVVAVEQGDVGFAYGAGLEFALNKGHSMRLDVGYRGFYGLVDLNTAQSGSSTYNVITKISRNRNGAYLGFTVLF